MLIFYCRALNSRLKVLIPSAFIDERRTAKEQAISIILRKSYRNSFRIISLIIS